MGLSRSFLNMLKARPAWEHYTGDDAWGNNVYAPPVAVEAFVGTMTKRMGQQDGQGQQDNEVTSEVEIITDYKGIAPKDRFTLATGDVVYVESAEVVHDQKGATVFQTITATTTERG